MVLAEFGSGQVLWSIFWFFLFVLWISLVIYMWVDIIRRKDLSGAAKAMWVAFLIFLPYLGFFVYLTVRGSDTSERYVPPVPRM